MALDLPRLHADALGETGRLVAVVGDDQWHLPTPCEDWDVRELVNHLVSGNLWVAPLITGSTIDEVGERLDGDVLGDDPIDAYHRSAAEADSAFSAEGAMDAPANVSYGPVPGRVYAGHRFIDVLVHGWDLAVGAGLDTTLRPDLVEACLEVVLPEADLLAASGAFGADHEVPEGASPQARLLALLGRHR
jgi:uncharacterized protein (TIGR03086 family)